MASYQQPKSLSLRDLNTLCEELHPVKRKWYDIGLQLQVPVMDLQLIEFVCKDDHSNCLKQMLIKWLMMGNATLEELCGVLRLIGGDRRLADELLDKYGSTKDDDPPETKKVRIEIASELTEEEKV